MYGVNTSSDSISRDMNNNSLLYSSSTNIKHPDNIEFAKIKQLISLDPYPAYNYQNQSTLHQQQHEHDTCYEQQDHTSLLRQRSTPSSFFSNLLNENRVNDSSDEDTFFIKNQQPQQLQQRVVESDSRRVDNSGGYGYNTNKSSLDVPLSYNVNGMDSTSSNLIRQNSTPAGFLSSLTTENAFASMKNGGSSSSSTLNNHVSFSSRPSSSQSRFLPKIAENKNELQDSTFSSLKRARDGVLKMPQNGTHIPNLVHHMSLPKTSSEMAAVENILHFQQEPAVPWKPRAKRGFATHPRSIAERVRRTRISERIKTLTDLFPDMDKQSTTADMLDMAVEYIKNLQKELQTLNDASARCKCSSKQLRST